MNGKEMTKAQERARAKLTHEWQCAHELNESLPTLEGLVAQGQAEMKSNRMAVHFPRSAICFRLKVPELVPPQPGGDNA